MGRRPLEEGEATSWGTTQDKVVTKQLGGDQRRRLSAFARDPDHFGFGRPAGRRIGLNEITYELADAFA